MGTRILILPLIIILFLLQYYSGYKIVTYINYLLYFLSLVRIVEYFVIRKSILRLFPNYYKEVADFRFFQGKEPLYFKYQSLIRKSKAPIQSFVSSFFYLGLLFIVISLIFHLNWLAIGIYLLTTSYSQTKRLVQPPIALLLASSNQDSFQLYKQLNTILLPDKITSLLHIPRNHNINDRLLLNDYLRTYEGSLWREVVIELLKMCKLIVIDARSDSQAVQDELNYINEMELWEKSLFIVGTNDERIVLDTYSDRNHDFSDVRLRICKIDEISQIRKYLD